MRTESQNHEREIRDVRIEIMLREGVLSTSEITRYTNAHRQQIARIRKRMIAAGMVLPKRPVLKRGRKKGHTSERVTASASSLV